MSQAHPVTVHQLGLQPYVEIWRDMQRFTDERNAQTRDEIWLLEHPPVFTQGQAGKPEHLINPGSIPVIQVDRGGQVTYHGPGQLIGYLLLDLRRRKLGIRPLVSLMEKSIVELLGEYGIDAVPRADAPGVYVNERKIASLGLRVRRGCSFHGLSLNVNMNLAPFKRINPCGHPGLKLTQVSELGGPADLQTVSKDLVYILTRRLALNCN
ncbi:MAG: lipoyl(octanoyl) transferase LipB [Gammaproteobacteria bacterium]|nr:lipoyl(octanoyl) transferase LipB [Gammaproteobacteria bacterium]